MHAIHPNARTTPAVRAEIARSSEPTGVLAKRFGVSRETIRKGRKRGPDDCQDRSARPHTLPWKASEEERAIVCALRRATSIGGPTEATTGCRLAADLVARRMTRSRPSSLRYLLLAHASLPRA